MGEATSQYEKAYLAVDTANSVEAAVVAVRAIYGLDNATYHLAQLPGSLVDGPYVKSTYPAEWLTRYLIKGYVRIDPVVTEGFSRMLPFDWSELTMTPQAADLFADFQAHGLAAQGYSVPVIDKLARRALFSVNARMSDKEWAAFVHENGAGIAEIAHKIHRKAMEEINQSYPLPRLGPRELECLTWSAQGKTAKETARLLNVSEVTVRDYLLSARLKLDAENITKAIAKAVSLRLINIWPPSF